MDKDKRLQILEEKMLKVEEFLPRVELWLTVLAEQFKLNRNFVLSLEKKPEAPKPVEPTTVIETPSVTPDA